MSKVSWCLLAIIAATVVFAVEYEDVKDDMIYDEDVATGVVGYVQRLLMPMRMKGASMDENLHVQLVFRDYLFRVYMGIVSFLRMVLEPIQSFLERVGLGPFVDKVLDFMLAFPLQTVVGISVIAVANFVVFLPDKKRRPEATDSGLVTPAKEAKKDL